MIRTVSLWIRPKGCSNQIKAAYLDSKHTRLKPQVGEYYLRYAGKWEAVGSDALLALDAKAAKEKLLRDVERGVVPIAEALPHLNPPAQEARLSVGAAISTYLTTGKAAQKDWRKHTRQCYTLALKLFTESCQKTYMDEIDGDDLRVFKVFLRKQRTSIGTRWVFCGPLGSIRSFIRSERHPQSLFQMDGCMGGGVCTRLQRLGPTAGSTDHTRPSSSKGRSRCFPAQKTFCTCHLDRCTVCRRVTSPWI